MTKSCILLCWMTLLTGASFSQTPAQEATNGLALYAKNRDLNQLDKAKKAIDRIYKTRKDSLSYRNNLLRAMIYSSLAMADPKRTLLYKRDPSEEALFSLSKLKNKKQNDEHSQEIVFIQKKLAVFFIEKANAELKGANFKSALRAYQLVDSLNKGDWKVTHNLALLHEKAGDISKAEGFYKLLTEDKDHSSPEYFLAFANMFEKRNNLPKSLEVLKRGRERFPDNRDLLFRIINMYADNRQYAAVTSLIGDAGNMDPKNYSLNYLAGFSYESGGNHSLAEKYYKMALDLNENNYDVNYSLGLLCLNLYLKNHRGEKVGDAKKYLEKALEIEPGNKNAFNSLSLLYKHTGDTLMLENIKNKLNRN